MKRLVITISLAFIALLTSKAQPSHPTTPIDTMTVYLIRSSATDFDNHRPPNPIGFRKVKLGHIKGTDGGNQYLLSGEFLTEEDKKKLGYLLLRSKPRATNNGSEHRPNP